MPLPSGTQVGRYRLQRLIAQGGMAEVYRADQELTAGMYRPAALKVIRPEYAESADFREMFLDEARTACTLSHPNIVHIYEVGEAEGLLYMAMELVPGQSLSTVARNLRDKGQRLSDEGLLAVGIFTCSALEAVHALELPEKGNVALVHRDVSPHNLLLTTGGTLKLIDFGIAKAATNKNLTLPGITKGKAGYFSPEQAMGKKLDGRSDLFSLGITLYKLAYGSTPFDQHRTHQARNTALVHGRWEKLSAVCPGLPKGFYDVVDKALRLKPEERFADARQMREALERVALESGVHVGPSSLSGYVQEVGTGPAPVARPAPVSPPEGPRTELLPPKPEVAPALEDQPPGRWSQGFVVAVSVLSVVAVGLSVLLYRLFVVPPPELPARVVAETTSHPDAGAGEVVRPSFPGGAVEGAPPRVSSAPVAGESGKGRIPSRGEIKMRPSKVAVVAEAPHAPAPVDEVIPPGEGVLRIGSEPDGEVRVGGKSYGTTPLNLPISSGKHRVEIVRPGKRTVQSSYVVKVLPDRTVRLKYYFAQNRWMVE